MADYRVSGTNNRAPQITGRSLPLMRRRVIATGLAVGGALAVAACGGRSPGKTASTGASESQTAKPVYGGGLRVPLASDFFTFDASIDAKIVNPYAQTLGYESLLTFKSGPGVDYYDTTLAPLLASSWEAPDPQTYILHVRKNVKFADIAPLNGRALTAADVKFSLEYQSRTGSFANAKIPPGDLSYMYEGLEGITTPDDATAIAHFGAPFAPFLNYASGVGSLIMPRELLDREGGFTSNIVGTGAFQLDAGATQHGTRWVFKKNAGYWDSGKPYLDTVNHIVLRDNVTTYSAFQSRQIDIVRVIDPQVAGTMQRTNPDAIAQDFASQQLGLYINNARPPLGDERVRRAVSTSIDRKEFDQTFAAGKGGLAMLGTLPGTFTQQEMAQIVKFDPADAKSLLSSAGLGNGLQLEIMMASQDTAPQAQLLQGQLKQAGINASIKTLDSASWAQRLHKGDFDLSLNAFAVVGDVDSKLYGNFYSKSPGNYVGAKDAAYDKLAEAQRQQIEPGKRREAIRQASRYIQEHGMSTALYLQGGTTFWQPSLKNYADHWEQYDWRAPLVWLAR
jgi:peptide/nickel transport system substrate-binding protein